MNCPPWGEASLDQSLLSRGSHMEILLSSRKLYGAFSFPFKWACWLGPEQYGHGRPMSHASYLYCCFSFSALSMSSASNYHHFFFPSPLALSFLYSFWWFCFFLPHFWWGGLTSDLHSMTPKKIWKYAPVPQQSWVILNLPEIGFGKLSRQYYALVELPSCAVL